MNPTPGIDPVSPQSFTAEQIVDVGSAKSLDDFFVILLHALDSFFFFFVAVELPALITFL